MFRQHSRLYGPMRMSMYAREEYIFTHQAGNSQGSLQCFVHNFLLDFFDTGDLVSRRMVFDLFHSKVVRSVEQNDPHDMIRRIACAG